MATWVIGDVHGCYNELQHLLDKIHFNDAVDYLWFVGDLVNRGPDSLSTLRLIYSLKHRVRMVLGNHDLYFLKCLFVYLKSNQEVSPTLQKLLQADDVHELANFLLSKPFIFFDKTFNTFVSHAGIPHIWSTDKALECANELSSVLQGGQRQLFLQNMYGDYPRVWDDSLEGVDRYRIILNYCTRMRFIDQQGHLYLSSKSTSETASLSAKPWFSFYPDDLPCRLLFGHWSALKGEVSHPAIVALDTACVWGGELTAYCLDNNEYVTVTSSYNAKK